jgi:hypothetical protein
MSKSRPVKSPVLAKVGSQNFENIIVIPVPLSPVTRSYSIRLIHVPPMQTRQHRDPYPDGSTPTNPDLDGSTPTNPDLDGSTRDPDTIPPLIRTQTGTNPDQPGPTPTNSNRSKLLTRTRTSIFFSGIFCFFYFWDFLRFLEFWGFIYFFAKLKKKTNLSHPLWPTQTYPWSTHPDPWESYPWGSNTDRVRIF